MQIYNRPIKRTKGVRNRDKGKNSYHCYGDELHILNPNGYRFLFRLVYEEYSKCSNLVERQSARTSKKVP